MSGNIFEFIKWQIMVGIPFLALLVAYLGWMDKRRKDRQIETKVQLEAIHTDVKGRISQVESKIDQRVRPTEEELRALQLQVRALELELARNYARRDDMERIFKEISDHLGQQIVDVSERVQFLTEHLLKKSSA